MDKYDLYINVNFRGCRANTFFDTDTITSIRKACVPLGAYEAQEKCINEFKTDKTCDFFDISDQVETINGTHFQCFTKCVSKDIDSFCPSRSSSAVTAYPTFVITFAALICVLLLSSNRGH